MSWSILGLQPAITKTATEYILQSNDFGGSQVRITGTGLTYDGTSGYLTGGSITGAQLIKNGELIQTVTFTTPLTGSSFNSFFAPAATLRASINSWGATAQDTVEFESSSLMRIYVSNNTTVIFEGNNFSPFTNNGTVTAIKHFDANGTLIGTVTAGMPMPFGVAAAAIGGDRGWYHYMTAGNNTVTHLSSNYTYEIDGGTGSDSIIGPASTGLFVPVSYKQSLGAMTINLTSGTATGAMGPDTLTNIQSVLGSNFNDTITGNANANYLDGDIGDDTIHGLDGDDRIYGNVGNDTLTGGNDDDVINGGVGNDNMDGGAGIDTVDYEDYNGSIAGVTVSLQIVGAQNTGGQGIDTLANIENVIGSIYNDNITGNTGTNYLRGNTGDDVIDGGAGDDILEGDAGVDSLLGGAGSDTVTYRSHSGTVMLNLMAQNAWDGAAMDFYDSIENAIGSNFNDSLTGSNGDNILEGLDGVDSLIGNGGSDTVSYRSHGGSVMLNLMAQNSWDGTAMDFYSSIENAIGSQFNDSLVGSDGDNILEGLGGVDAIVGNGGSDTVSYRNNDTGAKILLNNQFAWDGAAMDFYSSIENAIGSAFTDIFTGSATDNVFEGLGGADTFTGNGGNDTFRYLSAGTGADIITDFDSDAVGGQDKIDLSGRGFTAASLGGAISVSGTTTAVITIGTDTITLNGVASSTISATDFIF